MTNPSPNGTTGVSQQPTCQILANDTDGDILTVYWYDNTSGPWQLRQTNTSVTANSTVYWTFTQANAYDTTYWWKVAVNDTKDNTSAWYYFTTEGMGTSVDTISPYNIYSSPLNVTATGPSDLDNVSLHYRWSSDNISWPVNPKWYNLFTETFPNTDNNWQGDDNADTHQDEYWFVSDVADTADIAVDSTNEGSLSAQPDPPALHLEDFDSPAQWVEARADSGLNYWNPNNSGWTDGYINFTYAWYADNGEGIQFWTWNGTSAELQWYEYAGGSNQEHEWDTYSWQLPQWVLDETEFAFRFEILATGDADEVYVDNVTLEIENYSKDIWYEFASDASYPWNWSFDFPNGTGYYEFYSIGKRIGFTDESAPSSADAICYFNSNPPPTISGVSPSNGSTNIALQPTCQIQANDAEGDTLTVYWYENSTGSWVLRQTNSSIAANSTVSWMFTQADEFYTTYWWKVAVNDSVHNTTEWYYFTTIAIATSVDTITPYVVTSSPKTITATNTTDVDNITLYYRWSTDNITWGTKTISIFEGFESGSQNTTLWNIYQTPSSDARIQWDYGTAHSGSYSCAMDDADIDTGDSALNVIYTNYDFTGASNINIDFWQREWGDEPEDAPDSWAGWGNYDVVAFTNDGNTWYEIVPESSLNIETFTQFQYNISADPDFTSPPTSSFAIAFQQYDNYQLTFDGRAWDDIYINFTISNPNGTDWKKWSNAGNPATESPWSWNFDFPNSTGYYEFYSIGKKSGSPNETAPGSADARCRFNRLPTISNEGPSNGSTNVQLIPQMNITVNDSDEDTMTITWYSNSSGSWQIFGTNSSVSNGTYHQTNSNFSYNGTKYWWYVTAYDGVNTNTSAIYEFTTVYAQPTVITNASTAVEETDARLWGYLKDGGGETCTVRFEYGTTTSYGTNTTNQTVSIGQEFSADISGLNNGTLYHYRAYANNTYGSDTGDDMTFLTKPQPPTNLNAQMNNSNTIYLTWITGNGANNTYIEYNTSANWPLGQGTEIYNNSETYYEHTSLSEGTTYYYQAWSYTNWTDGGYTLQQRSDENASANNKTNNIPIIEAIFPINGSTGVSTQPICQIWANDSNGDTLKVYWYENTTGSYVLRNTNSSVSANSTVSYIFTEFNNYNTTYYWKVAVNDSMDNTTAWFYFKTEPINTSVDPISPYNILLSPKIITATNYTPVDNITLWYRYSTDNISWDSWMENVTLISTPWQWSFTFSNGTGYYEFYSIGNLSGSPNETAPSSPDAICYYSTIGLAPTVTLINPSPNGTTGIDPQPTCQIWANDTDGDTLDVFWYENTTGSWVLRQTNTSVSSNSTVSWTFTQANAFYTTYWWKVAVNDSVHNTSVWYYFTTKNNPPTIELISPSPNGTTNISLQPLCQIWANDTDGDTLTIDWYENSTGSYVHRNTNSSITANSTVNYSFTQFNSYSTTYYWKVAVNDTKDNITVWYYFTTKYRPEISNPNPANGSTEQNLAAICNVTVSDQDGGTVDVYFYENTTGSWVLQQINSSVNVNSPVNVSWNNYNNATDDTTIYWWKVNVTDSDGVSTEEIYHFTTREDNPPGLSDEYPPHQSINVSISLSTISVIINDADGDPMDWTIETSPNIGSNSGFGNVSSDNISCSVSGLSDGGITYYWYVNVTDGIGWTNETYYFTTQENTSIEVTPSQWNIGLIGLGNIINTTGFYFNITNNGTVDLNIQIKASNATNSTTGFEWKLNATPDFDNYSLQYNLSDIGTWTNINLTYDTFITNLAEDSWKTFDLKLLMATTSSKGNPLSVTVTFRSIVS